MAALIRISEVEKCIAKNPLISTNDTNDWSYVEKREGREITRQDQLGPLIYSRECELAVENYDFRRYAKDLEDQNNKLKVQMSRVRTALKNSTDLVAELQRNYNVQSKQIMALETENTDLKHQLSDKLNVNRSLTSGYTKQKKEKEKLTASIVLINKNNDEFNAKL